MVCPPLAGGEWRHVNYGKKAIVNYGKKAIIVTEKSPKLSCAPKRQKSSKMKKLHAKVHMHAGRGGNGGGRGFGDGDVTSCRTTACVVSCCNKGPVAPSGAPANQRLLPPSGKGGNHVGASGSGAVCALFSRCLSAASRRLLVVCRAKSVGFDARQTELKQPTNSRAISARCSPALVKDARRSMIAESLGSCHAFQSVH